MLHSDPQKWPNTEKQFPSLTQLHEFPILPILLPVVHNSITEEKIFNIPIQIWPHFCLIHSLNFETADDHKREIHQGSFRKGQKRYFNHCGIFLKHLLAEEFTGISVWKASAETVMFSSSNFMYFKAQIYLFIFNFAKKTFHQKKLTFLPHFKCLFFPNIPQTLLLLK